MTEDPEGRGYRPTRLWGQSIFFRCLAIICDGSHPATRRRGGYSEDPAGGQPGPTRAALPAAFGEAARGGGSCGGCGSGGRPQCGASQPADAADRGQVRACDMRATCLHSVLRRILRSEEKGKGRAGRESRVRACDMRATCLQSVPRSVLRSVERGIGRGGRGR